MANRAHRTNNEEKLTGVGIIYIIGQEPQEYKEQEENGDRSPRGGGDFFLKRPPNYSPITQRRIVP